MSMNREQKQAINFQAKHKARKQIDFSLSQAPDGNPYWKKFYNPFNDFLGMCSKRELALLVDNAVSDPDTIKELCKGSSREQLGSAILIKMQFRDGIMIPPHKQCEQQQSWFGTLPTKCLLICENGQGVKI